MDDVSFRKLLDAFDLSWEGYRKVRKGVKKRIRRHMNGLACFNMEKYLSLLHKDTETRQQCELLLTVSISRFFRDRHLWAALEKRIIPNFFKYDIDRIKVWSACCANGEEVYSLKIVWDHASKRSKHIPDLKILATDINPDCFKRAQRGYYSQSSLKEVPEEFMSRYFEVKKNGKLFAVKSSIKKNIDWKIHHMLSDPPEADFNIIFIRNNILTYYQDHLKELIFRKVYSCLCPSGYLIIGSHEKLPYIPEGLYPLKPFPYVFKKQI